MKNFVLKSDNFETSKVTDWMILGRDPECAVVVNDEMAAPRHARFEVRGDRWMIRDLRSEKGTWINGSQVSEAFLSPNDIIRVGQTEIQFCFENEEIIQFPISSKNSYWQSILEKMFSVSQTEYPVLLLGPSGTGKDVLAQKIHECSKRNEGPFVSVNCSALSETLIESELFGHVKGSFTGAIGDRKGAFEAARGGTLFLDEIGDLPLSLQAKLLRALENSEIRPVGSDRNVKTNVRIIAATHQNLIDRVEKRQFRSDLFYRLNVVTVHVPALNERMEDFEDLMYHFCRQYRVRLSVAAIQKMKLHAWPGNIRELKNFIARCSALLPGKSIEGQHVDQMLDLRYGNPHFMSQSQDFHNPAGTSVIKEFEKQMILKRLQANKGNQRRTATDLGIPKSTLHDRLKAYNINPNDFKFKKNYVQQESSIQLAFQAPL